MLGGWPDVFVGTRVAELILGTLVAKGCDVGFPAVSKVVWTLCVASASHYLFMYASSYSCGVWRAL